MTKHAHEGSGRDIAARLAILTVSDTRTPETDRSGVWIRERLESEGHGVHDYSVVKDDPEQVQEALEGWLGDDDCDGAIVNGGTGISRRDRTYEAVSALLDRRLDGFGELFRALSFQQIGSAAMMTRAVAGIVRGRAVFAIPGSPPAVELAMERLILPEIRHLLAELRKTT